MRDLLHQITGQLKYIPRSILMMILFAFAYLFIIDNGKNTIRRLCGLLKRKWMVAFLFYSAYMITSTVFIRYNKIPVRCVLANLWFRVDDIGNNNEIIKNILFFIPYTFLYCQACYPKKPMRECMMLSACTTAFIELSQLIFWAGEFQLADLLDNFVGGVIGCCLWYVLKVFRHVFIGD